MHRKHMRASTDKQIFTATAHHMKKINVKPKLSRGGIRM